MAMTAQQMVDFFRQRADAATRGLATAQKIGNVQLAALNCRQGVKSHLMSGLIQWRLGERPSETLLAAFEFYRASSELVSRAEDGPIEQVGFIAFLIGKPNQSINLARLQSDRLLDAQICNWLHTDGALDQWTRGMEELTNVGSELAIETYRHYKLLIDAGKDDQIAIFREVETLFEQRKRDAFFSGGEQTEGGGLDNHFVVDYRLAAIAKKLQVKIESIHAWRWST